MTQATAPVDYILHRQVGERITQWAAGQRCWTSAQAQVHWPKVMVPLGPYDMDATDISQQMLDVAAQKDLYHRVFWSDVTDAMPVYNATYDGVVGSGTFALGQCGSRGDWRTVARDENGGHIVISVNEHHWNALHFERALDAMADHYDTYETRAVAIYGDNADHEHKMICVDHQEIDPEGLIFCVKTPPFSTLQKGKIK